MEPERPTWLEKKPTRSDMRAITKAIRSGLLSQMPWTDMRIGQSPSRSSREEPHKPRPIRRIKFFSTRHPPSEDVANQLSVWDVPDTCNRFRCFHLLFDRDDSISIQDARCAVKCER